MSRCAAVFCLYVYTICVFPYEALISDFSVCMSVCLFIGTSKDTNNNLDLDTSPPALSLILLFLCMYEHICALHMSKLIFFQLLIERMQASDRAEYQLNGSQRAERLNI